MIEIKALSRKKVITKKDMQDAVKNNEEIEVEL